MAGSTIARTAHFALHCVMLNPPDAPGKAAPDSLSDFRSTPRPYAPPTGASGGHGPQTPALLQQKPQAMPSRKPLFEMFAVRDVWLGAMVPKRWAKRAVTRNAIKRQIYNVGTLAEHSLKAAAHVVRLRAGFDKGVYPSATSDALKAAVRQELVQLFARAAVGSQQMARAVP